MAITTLAQVRGGLMPPVDHILKTGNGATISSHFINLTGRYQTGWPAAAVVPTPGMAGVALTGPVGDLPYPAEGAGQSAYIAAISSVSVTGNNTSGFPVFIDRLWHSSGITITSTAAQTVNSTAWPARDINGSTNGEGVYIAVEVHTTTGAGSPIISISYTNSAGVAGRTGTAIVGGASATAGAGCWFVIGLQAGDTGVRSVQTVTLSATWTSGAAGLVAFRPIVVGEIGNIGTGSKFAPDGPVSLGLPKLHPNTFLGVCRGHTVNSSANGSFNGYVQFALG